MIFGCDFLEGHRYGVEIASSCKKEKLTTIQKNIYSQTRKVEICSKGGFSCRTCIATQEHDSYVRENYQGILRLNANVAAKSNLMLLIDAQSASPRNFGKILK